MLQWITIFSHDLPHPSGRGAARQEHIGSLIDRLDRPQHPARQVLDGHWECRCAATRLSVLNVIAEHLDDLTD